MTDDPPLPAEELAAFNQGRKFETFADAVAEWLSVGKDAAQFMVDFETLARVVSSPEFQEASLAGCLRGPQKSIRNKVGVALPFGPLRRMTRRLGPTSLRFILSMGSPKGKSAFRIIIRHRFDSEFPSGNHHKAYGEKAILIDYGNLVLRLERRDRVSRSQALSDAAEALHIVRSERSLERWFGEFVTLAEAIGYVPPPFEWAGSKPEFPLADLYRRSSARRQK